MTFDLEKAREVCKTLPKYMNGACPCKEEAEAAKMLIKALPEIERLRAASIEYQNALDDARNLKEQIETFHLRRENELRQMNEISWQNKTQAARIKELEALRSDILEAMRRPKTTSNDGLILYLKELDEYNIRTTKRVGELEDALVEDLARELAYDEGYRWPICRKQDKYRKDARKQLQAEGKIGPDTEPANIQALQRVMRKQHDHPAEMVELNADHQYQPEAPRSWQITDERKAAIERLIVPVEILLVDHGTDPEIENAVRLLRAMLKEVEG